MILALSAMVTLPFNGGLITSKVLLSSVPLLPCPSSNISSAVITTVTGVSTFVSCVTTCEEITIDGADVGAPEGAAVGVLEGANVGGPEGASVGFLEGDSVGVLEGEDVGSGLGGEVVGTGVVANAVGPDVESAIEVVG